MNVFCKVCKKVTTIIDFYRIRERTYQLTKHWKNKNKYTQHATLRRTSIQTRKLKTNLKISLWLLCRSFAVRRRLAEPWAASWVCGDYSCFLPCIVTMMTCTLLLANQQVESVSSCNRLPPSFAAPRRSRCSMGSQGKCSPSRRLRTPRRHQVVQTQQTATRKPHHTKLVNRFGTGKHAVESSPTTAERQGRTPAKQANRGRHTTRLKLPNSGKRHRGVRKSSDTKKSKGPFAHQARRPMLCRQLVKLRSMQTATFY